MLVQAPSNITEKTSFDLVTTAPVGGVVTSDELDPADPSVGVPEGFVQESNAEREEKAEREPERAEHAVEHENPKPAEPSFF
jgi:hypothetical protein